MTQEFKPLPQTFRKQVQPVEKTEVSTAIAKTVYCIQNRGCKPKTVKDIEKNLYRLNKHVDIFSPETVNNYIATAKKTDPQTMLPTEEFWKDGYKKK